MEIFKKTISVQIIILMNIFFILGCDDSQNENPDSVPAMKIYNGSTEINEGDTVVFGEPGYFDDPFSIVFTIENSGDAELILTGEPIMVFSGINPSDFHVTVELPKTIAAFQIATFTIEFNPAVTGSKTATATILSNDPEKKFFHFNLSGS